MLNLTEIEKTVAIIESELAAFKMVIESCAVKEEPFVPMTVFYTDKNTKSIVVAIKESNDLVEKYTRLAEVMHLYKPLDSTAATIALLSTVVDEDTSHDALTVSVLSDSYAWNIVLPFYVNEDSIITWDNDAAYINEIDKQDVDQIGRDIFSMLFTFTHAESVEFTPSEILSYLAHTGAAIHQVNTNIQYIAPELED